MAYLFKERNFNGPFVFTNDGSAYGQNILACPSRSTSCEEIAGEVGSIRVEANTILMISDSVSLYHGASEVIIGPAEIPNNTFIVNSYMAVRFRDYNYGAPITSPLVTLCNNMAMVGMHYYLYMGEYSRHRLMSEEIKLDPKNILSMSLANNAIVIIRADKTIVLSGPATINDMSSIGMFDCGKIHSIIVKYNDKSVPYIPLRPASRPVELPQTPHLKQSEPEPETEPEDPQVNFNIFIFLVFIIFVFLTAIIVLQQLHQNTFSNHDNLKYSSQVY
jgi:hypothetical protein